MAKLIITDFDKTLIKDNSERNFIFFLLVHCIELRLHVFLNLVSHLLLKIYFRVINKPLNYKIFYKNLPFKFLSKQVELFVLNQSSSFLLNDTIMRNIDKDKDSILILTKSPSFLSSGLCKLLLNDYSWFLKGTDLELKNGFFTGLIIDKLTSSLFITFNFISLKLILYGKTILPEY